MFKKEVKATKVDILKKIESILKEDINLDAKLVFVRIEQLLGTQDEAESFSAGEIGYVHIDEKRQVEYLEWEKNIKQEWLATIESIRESIRKE